MDVCVVVVMAIAPLPWEDNDVERGVCFLRKTTAKGNDGISVSCAYLRLVKKVFGRESAKRRSMQLLKCAH
jgi:hypothetical protein